MAPKRKPATAAPAPSSAKKKKQQQNAELMLAPGSELFMVIKSEGYEPSSFHSSEPKRMKPKGVYSSADEAYAAAIRFQVAAMERIRGEKMAHLRKAVVNAGKDSNASKNKNGAKDVGSTPFKDAYKRMNKYIKSSGFFADSEVISHLVMGPCKWLGSSRPQLSTLLAATPLDAEGESSGDDFGGSDEECDEDIELSPGRYAL